MFINTWVHLHLCLKCHKNLSVITLVWWMSKWMMPIHHSSVIPGKGFLTQLLNQQRIFKLYYFTLLYLDDYFIFQVSMCHLHIYQLLLLNRGSPGKMLLSCYLLSVGTLMIFLDHFSPNRRISPETCREL